jgi:hypothetical protein
MGLAGGSGRRARGYYLAADPMSPAESPFLAEIANWWRPFPLGSLNSTCFTACLRVLRRRGRAQALLSPQAQDAQGSGHGSRACETVL